MFFFISCTFFLRYDGLDHIHSIATLDNSDIEFLLLTSIGSLEGDIAYDTSLFIKTTEKYLSSEFLVISVEEPISQDFSLV